MGRIFRKTDLSGEEEGGEKGFTTRFPRSFEIISKVGWSNRINRVRHRLTFLWKADASRRRRTLSFSLLCAPCRLIWPASISPERLLRAGSEPIYPRATLTKTVGPFRHVPGWGSPLPCCPAFCIIRLEQLFDNWSKCAWYVSYTRGFDQRNG